MSKVDQQQKNEKLKQSVLKHFFFANGKLKHLPAQLKKKLVVLEHMTEQLEANTSYSEADINEWIKTMHDDYATIRRELYIHRFLNRERECYEVNAREQWRCWKTLS